MSKTQRGGACLQTGKIGRVNCLRQQMLMPGERMDINISGQVRLESLRERDSLRINAHLATFMTPLRWLWPEFIDYVKEGPNTAINVPSYSEFSADWAKYGIGTYAPGTYPYTKAIAEYWKDAPLKIFNEWYKWPESPDSTVWDEDGNKAVPLSKSWSRMRFNASPNDLTEQSAFSNDIGGGQQSLNIQSLAEAQARFRSAMKRDVTSFNRWMELVKETWKGDGSREVDKVPIMLDQTEVGVHPRSMPATDGASLGTWQSLYNFNVDHQIKGIVAPEHCIITTMLLIRFPSIVESNHPLAIQDQNWFELVADPEYLSSAQPQEVLANQIMATTNTTSLGYLPAGWQWRSDHDVIGKRIYDKGSFPYMEMPSTQAECKDATRIKPAFRSSSLGDYYCDLYFSERSYQPIGTSMDSYFSGMLDHTENQSQSNDKYPKGGKQL